MKNSTLILLGLVGVGIYLYLKNKKATENAVVLSQTKPIEPDLSDMKKVAFEDSSVNIKFAINGMRKIGKIPNTI